LSVEAYEKAGKRVQVPRPRCETCEGQMIFWSGYFRSVRAGRVFRIWVRRGRCKRCGGSSHALLPSFCLLRRLDAVEVIGRTVTAVSRGAGTRSEAKAVGDMFPYTTVRGWWRRHRERARAWLVWLAPTAAGWMVSWPGCRGVAAADAVEALKAVAEPIGTVMGVGLWAAVSLLTAGGWLSNPTTTTDTPFSSGGRRVLMAARTADQPRRPP
jgi:hypothetical protein